MSRGRLLLLAGAVLLTGIVVVVAAGVLGFFTREKTAGGTIVPRVVVSEESEREGHQAFTGIDLASLSGRQRPVVGQGGEVKEGQKAGVPWAQDVLNATPSFTLEGRDSKSKVNYQELKGHQALESTELPVQSEGVFYPPESSPPREQGPAERGGALMAIPEDLGMNKEASRRIKPESGQETAVETLPMTPKPQ